MISAPVIYLAAVVSVAVPASLGEVPRLSSAAHGLHCSLACRLFITPARIEPTSPALHDDLSATGLPGSPLCFNVVLFLEPLPLCSG